MLEGNHPFQVVWLARRTPRNLSRTRSWTWSSEHGYPSQPQIVFEGNVPADPAENKALARLLARRPADRRRRPWPTPGWAMRWPSRIQRRHLPPAKRQQLVDRGQNEEAALGIFGYGPDRPGGPIAAGQPGRTTFYIFDGSPPARPRPRRWQSLPGVLPGTGATGRGPRIAGRGQRIGRGSRASARIRAGRTCRRFLSSFTECTSCATCARPKTTLASRAGRQNAAESQQAVRHASCAMARPGRIHTIVWCDSTTI